MTYSDPSLETGLMSSASLQKLSASPLEEDTGLSPIKKTPQGASSSLPLDPADAKLKDLAGNTLDRARRIDLTPKATSYTDWVSRSDRNDYYRFELKETQRLNLVLTELKADADVELLNGKGKAIASSLNEGNKDEKITKKLDPGTYYIRVYPFEQKTTAYKLTLSAKAIVQPLPSVTIAATDANAAETAAGITPNPGTFTFTRTGPTDKALTVSYTVAGNAIQGVDYQSLTGSGNSPPATGQITIPIGSTTATLSLNVIDDSTIEDPETVVLNLNTGTGYQLGTTKNATISIADNDVIKPPLVTNPTVGTFNLTGDTKVDALLGPNKTLWNTSQNGGNITYSFYKASSGAYSGTEKISEVSDAIKNNVRQALGTLTNYLNVNFVEVEDSSTSQGVLRYMFSDGPGYAYAYYPNESPVGGDIHLSSGFEEDTLNQFSGPPGSYGYMTLIHETGHALGLKHPGNYDAGGDGTQGPYLDPADDNLANTLMTYNNIGANAITMMAYDIRSLQYLYGARNYQSGTSNYAFETLSRYSIGGKTFGTAIENRQTLWDSGGSDTLDFSNLATSSTYRFDLRSGGILTTQAAYNTEPYIDAAEGGSFTTTRFGTSIAFGTSIENVVTSKSSDLIIANEVSNVFSGYGKGKSSGSDIYEGTRGDDVLDLTSYSLTDLKGTLTSGNLSIVLDGSNTVQIKDYGAGNNDSMRVKLGDKFYRYNGTTWQEANNSGVMAKREASVSQSGISQQNPAKPNPNTPLRRAIDRKRR